MKKLIGTFIFPTIPNSCAVDNLEKSLFVGGNDGKIYYVNLSSFSSLSSQEISSIDTTKHTLKGHKYFIFLLYFKLFNHSQRLAITSLVVSFDSSFLISGSKGNKDLKILFSNKLIHLITKMEFVEYGTHKVCNC